MRFTTRAFQPGPYSIQWRKPPLSNGICHAANGDEALWRSIGLREYANKPWPLWGRGVVDLRPKVAASMVAGRLLRHALKEALKIIRMTPCEHKIGMCQCPFERFMFYQDPDAQWHPWLMCLLASTTTREGSWFLEASLILHLETSSVNMDNNINWTTSCDYGGEGPKAENEAHLEHFVYMVVKPLPGCISPTELAAIKARPAEPMAI